MVCIKNRRIYPIDRLQNIAHTPRRTFARNSLKSYTRKQRRHTQTFEYKAARGYKINIFLEISRDEDSLMPRNLSSYSITDFLLV